MLKYADKDSEIIHAITNTEFDNKMVKNGIERYTIKTFQKKKLRSGMLSKQRIFSISKRLLATSRKHTNAYH